MLAPDTPLACCQQHGFLTTRQRRRYHRPIGNATPRGSVGPLDPTITPGTPLAGVGAQPATPATHLDNHHQAGHAPISIPQIPGYSITGTLGQGGMGAVFSAIQTAIERPVAIKVMQPKVAGDGESIQRFLREAHAAGRVHHPNVVTIFDAGECEQGLFMVLEFVAGGDARQLAERNGGSLSLDAVEIIRMRRGAACARCTRLMCCIAISNRPTFSLPTMEPPNWPTWDLLVHSLVLVMHR